MVKTKGARPSPKKAPDQRTGHANTSKAAQLGIVVLGQADAKAPSLPSGYRASVKKMWREFWKSPPAQAVNREADMPALLHWAWCQNEMAEVLPLLSAERQVANAQGMLVLNPLAQYVQQLRAAIARAEVEFGMTSLSRSRLGLTIGQAKLTAQELNKRIAKAAPEMELSGEWVEA